MPGRHHVRKKKKKEGSRPALRRQPPERRLDPFSSSRERPSLRRGSEASLREKIESFAFQPPFRKHFERALGMYFGKAALRKRTLVVDDEELPGFQEWFIHDFNTGDGLRLIDRFADEVGPSLPEAEARLLDAWRAMNRLRLFEVQSIEPGVGVVVRDLLDGETLTVYDRSASRSMRRWMIVLARPHQAEDRVCFTGSSPALPPNQKKDMLDAARKLWAAYQARRAGADLSDFYRDHSLELLRAMRRLQEEAQRMPIVLTAEGHKVVAARAEYAIRDPDAVADILSETEEFICTGPLDQHPDTLHFVWLLRGRTHVPEKPVPARGAVALKTEWTRGVGQPAFRSLGDLTLSEDRLMLECMSRERLKVGKALLAESLVGLVKHWRDRIEPFEMDAPAPPSDTPAGGRSSHKPSVEELALEREMLERHSREWVDTPLPHLDRLSPRQAMERPEHQAEVVELLKYFEYMNEDRRANGERAAMDTVYIRRELRLPPG